MHIDIARINTINKKSTSIFSSCFYWKQKEMSMLLATNNRDSALIFLREEHKRTLAALHETVRQLQEKNAGVAMGALEWEWFARKKERKRAHTLVYLYNRNFYSLIFLPSAQTLTHPYTCVHMYRWCLSKSTQNWWWLSRWARLHLVNIFAIKIYIGFCIRIAPLSVCLIDPSECFPLPSLCNSRSHCIVLYEMLVLHTFCHLSNILY